MFYHPLKDRLKDYVVFSLSDIRKIDPKFYSPRLNDWQKKGYIKKMRRGYYMFADEKINEETLFLMANRLYQPSYVSFEMALHYYGLIPEGVYTVTSATSKKTQTFETPLGHFSYRKIKPSLFFGYKLEQIKGQTYKIAEIEKTVLDYLYLNPQMATDEDFYEWRFDCEEFLAKADMKKLNTYAEAFKNKALNKRLKKLLAYINNQK
jgi:predicted transcriptional regulator of viral defense system